MNCPRIEQLEDFARGSADNDTQASIDAHLSSCASCADLVREVRSNLDFGIRVQAAFARDTATALPTSELPRIAGYEVLGELGRGGMGIVYCGRQRDPDRPVALKLLAHGSAAGDYALRLFQREAAALARLRHAAIATVIDAGQTEDGRRYIAMEFIDGRPLDRYLAETRPGLRARLALFRGICDAVSHAHQRGVLHRDLKPANVLIEHDGQPRVLDFGLARISDDDSAATQLSEIGRIQGTLRYMSPEQAGGRTSDIDARTDVYSLGVMLFEMLTGSPPYDLGRGHLAEQLGVICEAAPRRPRSLAPTLPIDLEAITLRALEKRPADRYETVAQLAEDITRYLSDQPVNARPTTALYQLRKFARRHRALVTVATVALLGLIGTTSVAVVQAVRASRAEQVAVQRERQASAARIRAEQALEESESVTDFLAEMLTAGDPAVLGRDVLVLDVLDDAARQLDDDTPDPPAVETRLHAALGQAYLVLSKLERSATHFERAAEIAEEAFGRDDPRWLVARGGLGRLAILRREYDEAERILGEVIARQEQALGPDHPDTLRSWNRYVQALGTQGNLERRIELGEDLLRRAAARSEVSPYLRADFHEQLARAYAESGRSEDAESHYRRAIDILTREVGADVVDVQSSRNALALFLKSAGRYDEAETLQRGVLAVYEQAYGPDHHRPIALCRDLAMTLVRRERHDEAEPLLRRAISFYEERYGRDNALTLDALSVLSHVLSAQGRPGEAADVMSEVLAARRRVLGPDHPKTLEAHHNLGFTLLDADLLDEATEQFETAYEGRRRVLGERAYNTLNTMQALGGAYTRLERFDEAEALLVAAVEARRATVGEKHVRTIRAIRSLASLYRRRGDLDKAEPLYLKVCDLDRELLGPEHPSNLTNLNNLATLYRDQERYEEARELYLQVFEERRRRYGTHHPSGVTVQLNLAGLAWETDDLNAADRWYRSALETLDHLPEPPTTHLLVTLDRLAEIATRTERPADAVGYLARLRDLRAARYGPARRTFEATLALARGRLDADQVERARTELADLHTALGNEPAEALPDLAELCGAAADLADGQGWADLAAAFRDLQQRP